MRSACDLSRALVFLLTLAVAAFVGTVLPAKSVEFKRAADVALQLTWSAPETGRKPVIKASVQADAGQEMIHSSNTVLARRWAMTRARLEAEAAWLNSCARGACRDPRAATWSNVVALVKSVRPLQRPALVQSLFSSTIEYVNDSAGDDHWANPLSTLLLGAGDCEDHVLLKRAVLISAGYREADMQLLILHTASGTGHMALQVKAGQTLVLDNRYRYPVSERTMTGDTLAAIATDRGYYLVR
ncbi:transglutaminase-like cysteine peptidase [uncultured Roseibium sp.]|uniref:transglutaminase-like cysteine peptidase n=1 Tax=uncultured Roseibium sp. TaxID=1936171 RepID=UPI0026138A5A|nr:transglutaminase-like cysteine peptidase [uncultured Roseibium sp.]